MVFSCHRELAICSSLRALVSWVGVDSIVVQLKVRCIACRTVSKVGTVACCASNVADFAIVIGSKIPSSVTRGTLTRTCPGAVLTRHITCGTCRRTCPVRPISTSRLNTPLHFRRMACLFRSIPVRERFQFRCSVSPRAPSEPGRRISAVI